LSVQVKICGLRDVVQAEACVRLGADAIGLVFYPQSPRFVEISKAVEICHAVAGHVARVGVFVDMSADEIIDHVKKCGLDVAQLHGSETAELVADLKAAGVRVVKVLNSTGDDLRRDAAKFAGAADSFLVEAGKGVLPGGNAATWNWAGAGTLREVASFALAGGLCAENVGDAINAAGCDAVDVSSGVEISPGVKDMKKVKMFINRAKSLNIDGRRVF